MQSWRVPLRQGLLRAVLCAAACAASGCADTTQIDRDTTVTLSTPAPDLGAARDSDVAWVYHLSKSHATDDLVGRLDRERQRLAAAKASADGSQPLNILASEPPQAAVPVANVSAPLSTATSPATPKPGDPLATISDQQLDPAIVLALWHIDPTLYKTLFIENYPTTEEGVQHDFGDRLVKAKLTKDGMDYPIVALARYASTSDVAAAKLYTAAAVANGPVADRYAAIIAAYTKGHPDAFLPLLVRLEMPTRLATVSEPAGWCRIRPKGVIDSVPEDPDQLAMQRDLRGLLAHCKDLLRKPDIRRLADRRSIRRGVPSPAAGPRKTHPKAR